VRESHLESEKLNPFVELKPVYRVGIILYVSITIFLPLIYRSIIFESGVPYSFERVVLRFFYNFLLFWPIFFYKKEYGVLHPLLFPGLITLVKSLITGGGLFDSLLAHSHPIVPIYNTALVGWDQHELAKNDLIVWLLYDLSIVSYYIGFIFGFKFITPKFQKPIDKALKIKVFMLYSFVFGGVLVYLQSKGGITAHLSSFGHGREEAIGGEGVLHAFFRAGLIGLMIWYAYDKNAVKNPLFWLGLAVSIPIPFISTGSRSNTVMGVIFIGAIWMYHMKRMPLITGILAAYVGMLVVGILGDFRRSSFFGEVDYSILTEASIEKAEESYRADASMRSKSREPFLPVVAKGLDQTGYLFGKSYVGAILFFIPRAIWADKPHSVGHIAATEFFGVGGGTPPGPVGEAYWNFGSLGVFIIFFIFGNIHKFAKDLFYVNNDHPLLLVLYILFVATFGPGGMDMVLCFQIISVSLIIAIMLGIFGFKRVKI
jgi:hypothetical protein